MEEPKTVQGGMTPERRLRELTGALETASEADTVEILQKIGAFLISGCRIRVLDTVIEPLWVEAYYFRADAFPDCNTHRSDRQRDRFGKLYFHRRGYGGVDLCLSDSDRWYLSFLLKATLVNGQFRTQKGILPVLAETGKTKAELEELENLLVPAPCCRRVSYAARVNLTKPCHADAKLAAFSMDALSQYDFGFAHKVLRENVREYMAGYLECHPGCSGAEYRAECRRLFGWVPAFVRDFRTGF